MSNAKKYVQSAATLSIRGYSGLRRYEGAEIGRLFADWFTPSSSADGEIWSQLKILRNRSRDLIRNNEYALASVRSIVNNVVGGGVKFQSKVKAKRKPRKGDGFATVQNERIEAAWKTWTKARHCHTAGKLSFAQIERLAMRAIVESGEVLIRIVRKSFGGSKIRLALEIIESDRLADDLMSRGEMVGAVGTIKMGVEFDSYDRPIAYWIYPKHPGGPFSYNGLNPQFMPVRVPAEDIIHLFVTERPGQTRGVPWCASAIDRLRNMGEYEESELVKARAQAGIMGFIQTPEGSYTQAHQDFPTPYESLEISPGQVEKLAAGETFTGFDPSGPNPSLEPFMKFMLRGVASCFGVGYATISSDYADANYSSMRAAKVEERELWRSIQSWLIESFHEVIYEVWLQFFLMSPLAKSFGAFSEEELSHFKFTPRGFDWVDPSVDLEASQGKIRSGLSTVGRELAVMQMDYDELIDERKREIDAAIAAGVVLDVYPETIPVEVPINSIEAPKDENKPEKSEDGEKAPRAALPPPDEKTKIPGDGDGDGIANEENVRTFDELGVKQLRAALKCLGIKAAQMTRAQIETELKSVLK
ncbi:MAG: phage portal protein [Microcoleus sp.]